MRRKIEVVLGLALALCLGLSGCGLGPLWITKTPRGEGNTSVRDWWTDTEGYSLGNTELREEIKSIRLDWAAGSVKLLCQGDDSIRLEEQASASMKKPLTDSNRMAWRVDGDTLFIRDSLQSRLQGVEKDLVITLPKDFYGSKLALGTASASLRGEGLCATDMEISSASGDITLMGAKGETICLTTASGDIWLEQSGSTRKMELDTASGDIYLEGERVDTVQSSAASGSARLGLRSIDDVTANSASGDVTLRVTEGLKTFEASTASGDVTLELPEDLGFTLETDTASGELSSDLALRLQEGTYTAGTGEAKLRVSTSSGNIAVNGL